MEELDIINLDINEEDTGTNEVIDQPFSPSDIRLTNPPMNLGDLIDMIENGWINFSTDYQREENLWTVEQQSRLIESVLLGLRLPAFYFEEVSRRRWDIIDGLQRCCAIRNYCVDGSIVLTGMEFLGKQFNGKKYKELPFDTRRDIRMLPITVNLLDSGVPDTVKYVLFKRLNTGGISLKPQEIRNAVFNGKAIDTIKMMATLPSFITATRNKIPTKRKENLDFISRFVSFYITDWKDYKPDLEAHINQAMIFLKERANDEYIQKLQSDFDISMQMCIDIFGDRAFGKQESFEEKRKPLNKAYFEVISSMFAKMSPYKRLVLLKNKELLVENLQYAMHLSKSYRNSYSGGTGSKDSVQRRFSWVNKIIDATLNKKRITIADDFTIQY